MAKIEDSQPKTTAGGYERLVGDKDMAEIFTRAQSATIRNGSELEKIISDRADTIGNLDDFLEACDNGVIIDGSYLCGKSTVKKSSYKLNGHEPDFIAFVVDGAKKLCYVVELKDGDNFDTKKSAAEREMLEIFVNHIAPKIQFATRFYICCFNQPDKEKIVTGFKRVFDEDEVMTGREFCDILEIDYDDIVRTRRRDTLENFDYVANRMFDIEGVRDVFSSRYREHIAENGFYVDDTPDGEE